ncbi:putative uncharacterized protein DDB_G0291812 [Hermetia illucens]|uniref:putative uncharacterized protein DDB_G0291812 n=1 Tax=Hermetia illucens TaxID=343691 RepID=UPI0018CC7229|nr:putative uncharacterized protein DDB_G0291812 [Hermetia illucens]
MSTALTYNKELEPFLTIVELLYMTLATTGTTTLINFVTDVKLSTTVRLSLCNASITDFNSLKSELLGKYKNNRTIPQIHSVLNSTYQNKSGVTVYKDKILSLVDELNQLQIQELGNEATLSEKKVITRMNETYALTIFKKGLNDQLKNTIFSARPTTSSDAVSLPQELENIELQATSNINNNYSYNNNNRNNNNNGNNNHRNSNNNRSHRNRNNYNDRRNVHITTNQGKVIGSGEDTQNLPEINIYDAKRHLSFLIDTGADVSICKNNVSRNLEDSENRIKLTGITQEVTTSLGTSCLDLLIGNQRIRESFHIVDIKQMLQKAMNNYNKRFHSTIKCTLLEVHHKVDFDKIRKNLKETKGKYLKKVNENRESYVETVYQELLGSSTQTSPKI